MYLTDRTAVCVLCVACAEYWLQYYTPQSYVLILDFRDTFFQADPFLVFGQYELRIPQYVLHVFAEHHGVCVIVCTISSLLLLLTVWLMQLGQDDRYMSIQPRLGG